MTNMNDIREMLGHHHEHLQKIQQAMEVQLALSRRILHKVGKTMATLDRLTQEVAETSTAIDSALALITGLAEQIRQLEPTQEALDSFADELDAKQQEIAAAVAANTPAPPAGPPAGPGGES